MKDPASASTYVLNPLALSAETVGRFRLLIAAALIMTWSLAADLFPADPFMSVKSVHPENPINTIEGHFVERKDIDFIGFCLKLAANPEALRNLVNHTLQLVAAPVLVSAFCWLTFFFYMLATWWRLRSRAQKLEPSPKLARELTTLVDIAGLESAPVWYLKRGTQDGEAWGSLENPRLIIAADPRRLEYPLGASLSAVILHELGHVVNRDCESRRLAIATWQALLTLVSVTFLVLAWQGSWLQAGQLLARFAATAIASLAIWHGLVRVREYYADWRVMQWGFGAALSNRLKLQEAWAVPTTQGRQSLLERLLSQVRAAFSFHPTNRERLEAISEPRRLFQTSKYLAFVTGFLLALAAGSLGLPMLQLWFLLYVPTAAILLATVGLHGIVLLLLLLLLGLAAVLPLGYWLGRALGIQLLRSAVADLSEASDKWEYRRSLVLALFLTLGIEVGACFSPAGFGGWHAGDWMLSWLALTVLLVWVWLVQGRAVGRLVLGNCAGAGNRVRTELGLRMLLVSIFVPFLAPMAFGRAVIGLVAELRQRGILEFLGTSLGTFELFSLTTASMLVTVALIVNSILFLTVLLGLSVRLWRVRHQCENCGEPVFGFSVGRFCRGCGRPMASWLYFGNGAPSEQARRSWGKNETP